MIERGRTPRRYSSGPFYSQTGSYLEPNPYDRMATCAARASSPYRRQCSFRSFRHWLTSSNARGSSFSSRTNCDGVQFSRAAERFGSASKAASTSNASAKSDGKSSCVALTFRPLPHRACQSLLGHNPSRNADGLRGPDSPAAGRGKRSGSGPGRGVVGLRTNARRKMTQADGRLHLVTMLSPRSRPAQPTYFALGPELLGAGRCRMIVWLGHISSVL